LRRTAPRARQEARIEVLRAAHLQDRALEVGVADHGARAEEATRASTPTTRRPSIGDAVDLDVVEVLDAALHELRAHLADQPSVPPQKVYTPFDMKFENTIP
jgi:hypothetical protein